MTGASRPVAARVAITASNLIAPGIGLLWLGRYRYAAFFLLLFPATYLLLLLYYAVGPELRFTGYTISSGLIVAIALAAWFGSMGFSWRESRERKESGRWRWARVLAAVGAFLVVTNLGAEAAHRFYKPFYLPAEGMAPTLLKKDRLISSMRGAGDLRRGEIILFEANGSIYIKRVAALPGDRIGLRGGVVILNGVEVRQVPLRTESVPESWAGASARRLREQFPGERAPHEIYDIAWTEYDEVPELTIPAGHVFVLGDNRDRSADSRVPPESMGVGLVPNARIKGKALFYTWGPSGKLGQPVGG